MTDINLLLLGETGVGKTTFINALINYFHYKKLDAAGRNNAIVAAPVTISVINSDNKQASFSLNTNIDEKSKIKTSAKTKEYFVPFNGHRLRLIDSQGFQISEDDDQNKIKKVFKRLGHLPELHGVCFLFKSSRSEVNQSFEYLLRQTMSELDATATKNFIFISTCGRNINFYSYTVKNVLKEFLNGIKSKVPQMEIPLSDDNVFCVENEAFVNLVAFKCGANLNPSAEIYSQRSWDHSSMECKRLISYVSKLKPFKLQVSGTMKEIETFFTESSYHMMCIFTSNYRNSQKCQQLKGYAAEACKDVKQLIQRNSQSSIQKQPGNMDSRQMRELESFENDFGKRKKGNAATYAQAVHSKNANHEGVSVCNVSNEMNENLKKTAHILKNNERFIENVCEVVDAQQKEICKVLRNMAEFATFLETCGLVDNLKAEIAAALSDMKKKEEEESVKIFEELQQGYEQMKVQVGKEEKMEGNEEDVRKGVKKLEKLQHCQEVIDKLFSF